MPSFIIKINIEFDVTIDRINHVDKIHLMIETKGKMTQKKMGNKNKAKKHENGRQHWN